VDFNRWFDWILERGDGGGVAIIAHAKAAQAQILDV
jgi:hypothetical protein